MDAAITNENMIQFLLVKKIRLFSWNIPPTTDTPCLVNFLYKMTLSESQRYELLISNNVTNLKNVVCNSTTISLSEYNFFKIKNL